MPTLRKRLTRSGEAEYVKIGQRMLAAGADLPPTLLETSNPEWIRTKFYPIVSHVHVLPGACVFVIYVRLTALASVRLQGFELYSPDWPLFACILDDPEVSDSGEMYRLLNGSKFHRDEVVNHRVEEEGRFRRGDVVEGWLLAQRIQVVPAKYTDHSVIRLRLSVFNQFNEVHESTSHCRFNTFRHQFRSGSWVVAAYSSRRMARRSGRVLPTRSAPTGPLLEPASNRSLAGVS